MEWKPPGILLQGLAIPGQREHGEMPGEVLRARGMPSRRKAGLPRGSSLGFCCFIQVISGQESACSWGSQLLAPPACWDPLL